MVDRSRRYTPEELQSVLDAVRQGASVNSLQHTDLPRQPTLWRWMRARPELKAAYDAACAERAARSRALGIKDPARAGRPTDYTAELADEICALVLEGEGLRQIARRPGMPCLQSLCRWFTIHPEFRQAYETAWRMRTDLVGDDMVEIAEGALDVETWPQRPDGEWVSPAEALALAKLKIAAQMGRALRLAPKRFADVDLAPGDSGLTYEEKLALLE